MTFPTFGVDNLFDQGTLSADSEATGFEKERAIDGFTFDGWQPSSAGTHYITVDMGTAVSADYWAFFSRDLATNGGSIKPQYSSDNFSGDVNDFDAAYSPSVRHIHMAMPGAQSARYWRFEVISSPVSTMIAVAIGTTLTAERDAAVGFAPPSLQRKRTSRFNRSEGGQLLGLSLRDDGIMVGLALNNITPTWMRANWRSFLYEAEAKSFFFSWRPDERGEDAAYVQVDTERSTLPAYSGVEFMAATLQLIGHGNPAP